MIKRFTEVKQNGSNAQSIPIGTSAEYITLNDGSILQEALGDINLAEDGTFKEQIQTINNNINSLGSVYAPLNNPQFVNNITVNNNAIIKGTVAGENNILSLPSSGTLRILGNNNNRIFDIKWSASNVVFDTTGSEGASNGYAFRRGGTNAITITSNGFSAINTPKFKTISSKEELRALITNGTVLSDEDNAFHFVRLNPAVTTKLIEVNKVGWGFCKTVRSSNQIDIIFQAGQSLYSSKIVFDGNVATITSYKIADYTSISLQSSTWSSN